MGYCNPISVTCGGAERVGPADEGPAAAVPEGAVDVAEGDGAGVLLDGRGAPGGVSVAGAGAGAAAAGVQRAVDGAPLGVVDIYLGLLTHGLEGELARRRLHPGMDPAMRRKLLQDVFARAAHPAWRWTMAANESRLPWRQLVAVGSPLQERPSSPTRCWRCHGSRSVPSSSTRAAPTPSSLSVRTSRTPRWPSYSGYGDFITGLASVEPRTTWYRAKRCS